MLYLKGLRLSYNLLALRIRTLILSGGRLLRNYMALLSAGNRGKLNHRGVSLAFCNPLTGGQSCGQLSLMMPLPITARAIMRENRCRRFSRYFSSDNEVTAITLATTFDILGHCGGGRRSYKRPPSLCQWLLLTSDSKEAASELWRYIYITATYW